MVHYPAESESCSDGHLTARKRCSQCGEVKTASEFHRSVARPSGLVSACKSCVSAARKRVYLTQRDKIVARVAAYQAAHREEITARRRAAHGSRSEQQRQMALRRQAAYVERHREQVYARTAVWEITHPDARRIREARRRAYRAGVTRNDFSIAIWKEVLAEFGYRCAYCLSHEAALTQEHMTPLSRNGAHARDNIVPACRSCNFRKHAKTLLEFVAAGGIPVPRWTKL